MMSQSSHRALRCLACALLLAVTGSVVTGAPARSGGTDLVAQRELAADQLEWARETVARARTAAADARVQLDQFVSGHFDDLRVRGETPVVVPERLPGGRKPASASRPAANAAAGVEAGWINEQLQELTARRASLLNQYTAEHPQIADIEVRISEFKERLAAIKPPQAETDRDAEPGPSLDGADPQVAQQLSEEKERHQEASRQYQEALSHWQIAERDLQAAEDAAAEASEKLAAIDATIAVAVSEKVERVTGDARVAVEVAAPTRHGAVVTPGMVVRSQKSSTPLVAAAFLVALLVAAVAAVKLARASSEVAFTSVDEAAAVLALPVVGVIPRNSLSTASRHAASRMPRGIVVLGELLVALFVFGLVACCMQNPNFLWELCTDPFEAFR